MTSIRGRLVFWNLVGVTVFLGLGSFVIYAIVRGRLEGEVDRFRAEVVAALDEVIEANPGRRVAVFCHGGVVNAWLSHLLGVERLFLFEPVYTGVSRFLAARSGERSLTSLNEAAHLR